MEELKITVISGTWKAVKINKNIVKFNNVEWFKMYSLSDNRTVGKAGNMMFAEYTDFNPQKAVIFGQSYIDKFQFKPLSSNFKNLVKIEIVNSENVFDLNAKTGIFE